MRNKLLFSTFIYFFTFLTSCTLTGPSGIFGKKSPHEQYGQKLIAAGLKPTALGTSWFAEAGKCLYKPLNISIPYKETGYFAAERPRATALQFQAKKGQRIAISLQKKPALDFTVYIDLWEVKNDKNKKLLAYADSNANPFSHDIDDEGVYILRLQPELLSSGEYTLTVIAQPSLAFPVKTGKIGSFWGDDRDEGARRHEGIDIFASKRTPATAAAGGVINRVGENKLGGKIVFLRPDGKNYSLYYAHLEEQLVSEGQKVKEGDTIGLVGNTGNAINTLPHLHFGIYALGGAINPLPFINPDVKRPSAVTASISPIGKSMRTVNKNAVLRDAPTQTANSLLNIPMHTLVLSEAATSNWYKVSLPDGMQGYISSSALSGVSEPIKTVTLKNDSAILDRPQPDAARKLLVASGAAVTVLGVFKDFYFVSFQQSSGWLSM